MRFDLNGRFVRFDGKRLLHRNDAHEGDRYVIVLYNPDFSYHDTFMRLAHDRTETIRHKPIPPPHVVAESTEQAPLLAALQAERRWVSRSSRAHLKYGANDSHTLTFGLRRSRRAFDGGDKAEPCTANKTHATLLAALGTYLRGALGDVADEYAAWFVARNSACQWHLDSNNVGDSIITTVGNYTGGELLIQPQLHAGPCAKCKRSNTCRRMCREHYKHEAPEWWVAGLDG